jgi:hypothetical protein
MEDKNMMYMQQNMDLEEVGVVRIVTWQSRDGNTVIWLVRMYIL